MQTLSGIRSKKRIEEEWFDGLYNLVVTLYSELKSR
jgi:hypothetical protein